MYARMSYWSCKPESWGDDARLFEAAAIPIARKHKGFVRAMLLGEEGATGRVAFGVWTNSEAYSIFVRSPVLRSVRSTRTVFAFTILVWSQLMRRITLSSMLP